MVPLVLLVHPDPPWSTFSVKFQKVWIRMDCIGPGGPRGPQEPLVDQERSGPPWTMLRHFPDGGERKNSCSRCGESKKKRSRTSEANSIALRKPSSQKTTTSNDSIRKKRNSNKPTIDANRGCGKSGVCCGRKEFSIAGPMQEGEGS